MTKQPNATSTKKIKARLARIEGQIRGLQAMLDQDSECEQVLQQMSAVRGAMDRAFVEYVSLSITDKCLGKLDLDREAQESLENLTTMFVRYG